MSLAERWAAERAFQNLALARRESAAEPDSYKQNPQAAALPLLDVGGGGEWGDSCAAERLVACARIAALASTAATPTTVASAAVTAPPPPPSPAPQQPAPHSYRPVFLVLSGALSDGPPPSAAKQAAAAGSKGAKAKREQAAAAARRAEFARGEAELDGLERRHPHPPPRSCPRGASPPLLAHHVVRSQMRSGLGSKAWCRPWSRRRARTTTHT